MSDAVLLQGDCLEVLKELPDNSLDSLVTDPPAGISFMGKAWDDDKGGRKQWITWMTEVMSECLRVLKPGAHGLIWAIPRTSHWTATALEDAGFEVRDVVTHLFGSGFPKSHNIEKATGDAKFAGWGTALKPASEHWILVRKPCSEKTVAANAQKWGTGAINIDASRIGTGDDRSSGGVRKAAHENNPETFQTGMDQKERPTGGRFPANLVLTEGEATEALDAQSGITTRKDLRTEGKSEGFGGGANCFGESVEGFTKAKRPVDLGGGASRFFYCAKISTSERGEGNTHPTVKPKKLMSYLIRMITPPGGVVLDPFMGSGSTGIAAKECGFDFIGVEKESEYFQIAEQRINSSKETA